MTIARITTSIILVELERAASVTALPPGSLPGVFPLPNGSPGASADRGYPLARATPGSRPPVVAPTGAVRWGRAHGHALGRPWVPV